MLNTNESKYTITAGDEIDNTTPVVKYDMGFFAPIVPYPTDNSEAIGFVGVIEGSIGSITAELSPLYVTDASYTFTTTGHFVDPIQSMISRIEQLEHEVNIFKVAAQTLKEINCELRDVSVQPQEDPAAAYERAMKVVK